MLKIFRTIPLAALALAGVAATAGATVADKYPIPASDAKGVRGATVSYTRYDCNDARDAELDGGATLERDKTWNRFQITSQASDQTYVKMPVGATVTWNMNTYGDGVTVRYTIADKHDGGHGQEGGYALNEGELEFYVNDQYAGKVVLSSYYMYHYFKQGVGDPSHSIDPTASPAFAFDERHTVLSRMMKPGDRLTVKCTSGDAVGVDFVETEVVPEVISEEEAGEGRQVFNVLSYGAKADDPSKDNRGAFNAAIAAANKVGGVVYVPEGTWYMGMSDKGNAANQQGIWGFSAKNVKITGAGMWHTNIQFTGWLCFGGGVSAGNPTIGGTSDADNLEFCNMYLNSNLSWRNEPQAVYKAFMDLWTGGSVIHDVWMEHFEAGIWFGDYNGNPRRACEDSKIVNCRIRNNLADGVNFCQGTSNSAVINCNVRNSGDDGLAMWANNDGNVKNEDGNIFCFNTVEHIWRAGAIAVYGGTDQKVYNNWIGESFISSGFHANDTFPGHKWGATADKPVIVENNYFVRAGSYWDIFNRPYGAIDLQDGLSNIIIRNNHFWECPAEAISVHNAQTNVVFDGVYVNGAGLSGQANDWSASNHTLGAGGFQNRSLGSLVFKNFELVEGSVPPATIGAELDEYEWPFWGGAPDFTWVSEDAIDWAETPPYPDSEGIIPAPDPFETLTDYDIVLTGIDWTTNQGKHSMYEGDIVTFRVRIDNKGIKGIPEDAKFTVRFNVDNTYSSSYTVKEGIGAGESMILEFPVSWAATLGEHTFTATVDPAGKLLHEINRTNNTRVKNVNVRELPEGEEPEIEITTHSGPDMGVVKVYFENLTRQDGETKVGDILMPHAIVANYGSETIRLGSGQGVLWALNGTPEYNTGMLWDDTEHTVAPGEWIDVTPCGGGMGNGSLASLGWNTNDWTYTVSEGTVDLWCRMDSPAKYNDNDASNNALSQTYDFPKTKPVYNENPDRADNLATGGYHDYEDEEGGSTEDPVTGFDLVASAVNWTPGHKEIEAGQEIGNFEVVVKNNSTVAFPSEKTFRVTYYIDGQQKGYADWTEGIESNGEVAVKISGNYTATAGAHTVKAVIRNVAGELSTDNNSRERTFNAKGDVAFIEPATEYVTGFSEDQVNGMSLVIRRIFWSKPGRAGEGIRPGDKVVFSAEIYNNGTERTPDRKHGMLLETLPSYDPKYWSDDHKTGLAPGESMILTTCGGSVSTTGEWTAAEGTTNFRVMLDDQNDFGLKDKPGMTIQSMPVEIVAAPQAVEMHENPTGADNVETGVGILTDEEMSDMTDVWYTLQGIRVKRPTTAGVYIHNGKKVVVK